MTEIDSWLGRIIPLHNRLTDVSSKLLRDLIDTAKIEYLSIDERTKDINSIIDKISRKGYTDFDTELTDITGVRVVTFLESQVEQISSLIRDTFEIDQSNSLDRSKILGSDKVGYRSAHFVCTLGEHRKVLAEYRGISTLKFEIQIRTVLQHAWAELAHDRSFKFRSGLPQAITRKINLFSGMLELVDSGFDSVSREIDAYVEEINHSNLNDIAEAVVDRVNLSKVIDDISKLYQLNVRLIRGYGDIDEDVIRELNSFGISKITELRS
jgi:putative GTP pyrophosphokinase